MLLSKLVVKSCITLYSTSSDNDLLHVSLLPTDHFQKSLPRLPIPKLEKTCERYLTSQRVILSDEEYATTEKLVKAFGSGEGVQLNEALVAHDKANKHTNYVSGAYVLLVTFKSSRCAHQLYSFLPII